MFMGMPGGKDPAEEVDLLVVAAEVDLLVAVGEDPLVAAEVDLLGLVHPEVVLG